MPIYRQVLSRPPGARTRQTTTTSECGAKQSFAPKSGLTTFATGVILQAKFPVTGQKLPVLQNIFPVNLRREFHEKSLRRSGFLLRNRSREPRNRKIPC